MTPSEKAKFRGETIDRIRNELSEWRKLVDSYGKRSLDDEGLQTLERYGQTMSVLRACLELLGAHSLEEQSYVDSSR